MSNTFKLFYRKFPYKLSFLRKVNQDYNLFKYIENVTKGNIKIRTEAFVNVFSDDLNLVNDLANKFNEHLVYKHIPDANTANYIASNEKTEIKKKLTHGCRYKVILSSKYLPKSDNLFKLKKLIDKNPSSFHIPFCLERYLDEKIRYLYGSPYFHVKDEKYLMLVRLILDKEIKEVITIITYDELNERNTQ